MTSLLFYRLQTPMRKPIAIAVAAICNFTCQESSGVKGTAMMARQNLETVLCCFMEPP